MDDCCVLGLLGCVGPEDVELEGQDEGEEDGGEDSDAGPGV